MRELIKISIVIVGVTLYLAVSVWRINRKRNVKPSPLARFLQEREHKRWLDQHNKRNRRAV